MDNTNKDMALEALRGMAAMAVVFGHSRVMFDSHTPFFPPLPQIFHLVVQGSAAVIFFFVLSGFVLTRKFVSNECYSDLIRSALKRYFRLAGPVAVSYLLSAALFMLGLYHYLPVADMTHSPWLRMFGYSIPEQMHFVPSFTDALVQGGFLLFFVRGHHFYNSPTGTLYFESMGSFLIFALAFGVVMARKINGFVAVIFWLICMAAAWFFSPFYVAFVAGLGLSLFFSTKPIAIPPWAGLAMIVASTFFLSYEFQAREYAFLGRLGVTPAWEFYINMAGAVMLILGVESNPKAHRWLTGRFGAFLGRLSFPIYLVHFLILTSIGCYVWLLLIRAYGPDVAMVASIFVSVVVSVVASLPMMAFDRWWTSQVNRVAIVVMRAITGSPPLRLLQAQSPRSKSTVSPHKSRSPAPSKLRQTGGHNRRDQRRAAGGLVSIEGRGFAIDHESRVALDNDASLMACDRASAPIAYPGNLPTHHLALGGPGDDFPSVARRIADPNNAAHRSPA